MKIEKTTPEDTKENRKEGDAMGFLKALLGEKLVDTAAEIVHNKINSNDHELKKQFKSLEKLKELYDAGIITEKEYNQKKKQILKNKK